MLLIRHACGLPVVTEKLQPRLNVAITRVEVCCTLIGIKRVSSLVVARLVLNVGVSRGVQVIDPITGNLTRVPRSYHTSEMYGFKRIAREYASRASRYWLI